jgi:curved DNA-binding protein CbpA
MGLRSGSWGRTSQQPPVVQAQPEPAEVTSQVERVAAALRTWSEERADADLTLPPVQKAKPLFPEPEPEPPAVTITTIVLPAPPVERVNEVLGGTTSGIYDFETQGTPNYYEALQISPRADHETIHRIYRILAARFHPDNPVSGDYRLFLQLKEAYEVLSDVDRRAQYDAALQEYETRPLPIFGRKAFVTGVEGESNRRLGVLALLYQRRRINQSYPGMALLELEKRMAIPREYLEFSIWYLLSKGFVHVTDERSDYALTAAGVDYVESHSNKNHIVRQLLNAGNPGEQATRSGSRTPREGKKIQGSRKRRAAADKVPVEA